MTTFQQIKTWSATHHPRWLVIVRIALGLFLFSKGITFMRDTQLLERLIYGGQSLTENTTHWLPIFITWINLLGGFLIIIGLMTRFMTLIQIPILVGAIVFNGQRAGIAPESELGFAIVTLLLLIFFLIEGSGPLSLDAYFQNNRNRGSQGRNLP